MPRKLPTDCLNEILEHLENDEVTLHSCLLVNCRWCEISVRILWRNFWNVNTLISCLPNESMELFCNDKVIIPSPISKPPLFNYVGFVKSISIYKINSIAQILLEHYHSITPPSDRSYKMYIVIQEIFKMFMSQSTLKEVYFESKNIPNISFISYPGSRNCLKNITRLSCHSDIYPDFFHQLSRLCHNIQYLDITLKEVVSNMITELISVQRNLKYLTLKHSDTTAEDLTDIIPSSKISKTLIALDIYGESRGLSLSFITKLTNLQELTLSFQHHDSFEDFDILQHIRFPQLQVLKFELARPRIDLLTKFLENNGSGLREFYVVECAEDDDLDQLSSAIDNFCKNLTKVIMYDFDNYKWI